MNNVHNHNMCCNNLLWMPDSCSLYCVGRVTAFLSSLLLYLKENKVTTFDATVYTKGRNGENLTPITLSQGDSIIGGYLMSNCEQGEIAFRINTITEILLPSVVYINSPAQSNTSPVSCITLQIADILPPDECIEMIKTKELLTITLSEDEQGNITVHPFNQLKLLNLTLNNPSVCSIAEGMATYTCSNFNSVFAPYSSITALSAHSLH